MFVGSISCNTFWGLLYNVNAFAFIILYNSCAVLPSNSITVYDLSSSVENVPFGLRENFTTLCAFNPIEKTNAIIIQIKYDFIIITKKAEPFDTYLHSGYRQVDLS